MKAPLLSILLIQGMTTLLCAPAGAQVVEPILIPANYSETYMPVGFDSNDNVQIAAEGRFPSTCFRPGPISWELEGDKIFLTSKAYKYDGPCFKVVVPYHQVIDLGVLKQGKYQIIRKDGNLHLGNLTIKEATVSTADDYLYAPISQSFISMKDNQNTLSIAGNFANSCMKLKEVKINIQTEVIVVQPIAEMTSEESCEAGSFPFEYSEILYNLKEKRYLLHVRSLNGASMNTLVFL